MVLQLTGENKKMETKKRMTKNLKLMLFGATLSVILCFAVIASFPTVKVKTAYSFTPVPNTAITPTALKPYVLETPFAGFDFYIGSYANGSYYAVNASNWNNFAVDTNATTIINYVLGNLTADRTWFSTIQFAPGTYTLTGVLTVTSYTKFQGACTFDFNSGATIKIVNSTNSGAYYIEFENIMFDGQSTTLPAVSTASLGSNVRAEYIVFDRCRFYDWRDSTWALDLLNLETSFFEKCMFQGCASNGGFVRLANYGYNTGNIRFSGCQVDFWLVNDGSSFTFCQIGSNSGGIEAVSYEFDNNHFIGISATNCALYAVQVNATDGKVKQIMYQHNRCEGVDAFDITDESDQNVQGCVISDNIINPAPTTPNAYVIDCGNDYSGNLRDSEITNNIIGIASGKTAINANYGGANGEALSIFGNRFDGTSGTRLEMSTSNSVLALRGITLPFATGTEATINGTYVNDTSEFAAAFGTLPQEVYEIAYIQLWGKSGVTEADKMELTVNVYGATDNEAFGIHSDLSSGQDSSSSNFTAGDVITWKIRDTTNLSVMSGNDALTINAIFSAIAGGNCATDCYFNSIVIYVI